MLLPGKLWLIGGHVDLASEFGRLGEVVSSTVTVADDESAEDLVVGSGSDLVDVQWECHWPGAAGGYNGVELVVNGRKHWPSAEDHVPGEIALFVRINYKSDYDDVAARITEEAEVTLTWAGSE